jgi:phosphatidylserine synthase
MVSRIPTFSTKAIKLPAKFGLPALAAAAFLIACLVHLPWITMTIGALFYMASIPFAIKRFRELQKEYSDDEGIADLALGAIVIEEFSTIKDKQDAP